MADTPVKCLIVSSSVRFYSAAKKLAEEELRCETALAATVRDGRGMLLTGGCTLVLINAPLPDEFGLDIAAYAAEELAAGVILFTAPELLEQVREKAAPHGVVALPKNAPVSQVKLTLSALAVSAGKLREARRENDQLKTEIETVKLMSRAKLILMQHFGMTEKEAHKYIEQRAMESRSSRRAIVENIIKSYE